MTSKLLHVLDVAKGKRHVFRKIQDELITLLLILQFLQWKAKYSQAHHLTSCFWLTHFVDGVYTTKRYFGDGVSLERTLEPIRSHDTENAVNVLRLQWSRAS